MPTYVLLWTWTDQGVKAAKDSVKRLESGVKEFEKLGISVKDSYWTMGVYDGVVILEAPDDATMSRAVLGLGMLGNVRTVTARAYTKNEIGKILNSLP